MAKTLKLKFDFVPVNKTDYSLDAVKTQTAIDEKFAPSRYNIKGEKHNTIGYGHYITDEKDYLNLTSELGIIDPDNLTEPEAKKLYDYDFNIRREEIGKKYKNTSPALLDIMANKKMQYSPDGFDDRFGEGLKKGNPLILEKALIKEAEEKVKIGQAGFKPRNENVIKNLRSYTADIQEKLKEKGVNPGQVDGKYGPITEGAVKDFQKKKGLSVDGNVGKNTWHELISLINPFASEASASKIPKLKLDFGKQTNPLKLNFDWNNAEQVEDFGKKETDSLIARHIETMAKGENLEPNAFVDNAIDILSGGMTIEEADKHKEEVLNKAKALPENLYSMTKVAVDRLGKDLNTAKEFLENPIKAMSKPFEVEPQTEEEKIELQKGLQGFGSAIEFLFAPFIKQARGVGGFVFPEEGGSLKDRLQQSVKDMLVDPEAGYIAERIGNDVFTGKEKEGFFRNSKIGMVSAVGFLSEVATFNPRGVWNHLKRVPQAEKVKRMKEILEAIEKDLPKHKEILRIVGKKTGKPIPENVIDSLDAIKITELAAENPVYGNYLKGITQRIAPRFTIASQRGALKFFPEKGALKSNLLAVANSKLPGKVLATQAIKTLQNAGLSKEEIEFSGVEEFIKGKDKIDKQELIDYIEENKVKVEPIVKGEQKVITEKDIKWKRLHPEQDGKSIIGEADGTEYMIVDEGDGFYVAEKDGLLGAKVRTYSQAVETLNRYLEKKAKESNATKYSQYQLPGGEGYQETLLTLPSEQQKIDKDIQIRMDNIEEEITYPETEEERKIELRKEYKDLADKSKILPTYKSSHWDEPNPLVHHRTNQRTDSQGNKGTFVEEIQSDWHREGKSKGYKGVLSKEDTDKLDNLYDKIHLVEKNQIANDRAIRDLVQMVGKSKQQTSELSRRKAKRTKLIKDFKDVQNLIEIVEKPIQVPNAPFKKTWHELALKDVIRQAVDRGDKFVSFISGEQTADRYDLSKQVDEIKVRQNDKGEYVTQINKDGRSLAGGKKFQDEKGLAEFIGKDLANKIVNDPKVKPGTEFVSYSGQDLKVGGEWAKKFYDEILPQTANKYIKKWGSKIEDIYVGGKRISPKQSKLAQKGFYITPQMAKEVTQEGQPLFGRRLAGNRLSSERGMGGAEEENPLPKDYETKPEIFDLIEGKKAQQGKGKPKEAVEKPVAEPKKAEIVENVEARLDAIRDQAGDLQYGADLGEPDDIKKLKELNIEYDELMKRSTEFEERPPKKETIDITPKLKIEPPTKSLLPKKKPEEPKDLGKLRQKVHAWRKVKGMPISQMRETIKRISGRASLSHKDVTAEHLEKIIASVKASRPRMIGHKTVIRKQTEDRIQTLKKNLIAQGEMTEEIYQKILDIHKIKEPKYKGKNKFITESKGKEIIKRMLDSVPVVKDQIAVDKALEKNPAVKKEIDKIKKSFEKKYEGKPAKVNSLLDMHHFADSMEKQTGVPFGRFQEKITCKRKELNKKIEARREEIRSIKDYQKIIKDKKALDRINDYVASQLPGYVKGKPEMPANITADEKKIANIIQTRLSEFENDVRYNRFYEWHDHGTRIPNAPESELNRAEEILETKGDKALREWLNGRSWGIIRTGYDIGEVLKPSIKTFQAKPGVSKGHLKQRENINFQRYERDIIQRYFSYTRQMTYKTELNRDIKAFQQLFDTNKDLFDRPDRIAESLSSFLREVLGQRETKSLPERWFFSVYSQAARALFLDIRKGIRNLFQNAALYPSQTDFLRMGKLSESELDYFKTHVSQNLGIKYDLQMLENKGIPGLRWLNEIADNINIMGRTDEINRIAAFKATKGRVKRAIKSSPNFSQDEKGLTKVLKKAGISDLEEMEIVHALEELVTNGEEAMSNYIAKAVTQKVHFLYERSQRSPAEQGNNLRRVLSNLFAFRKGYIQRLVLASRRAGSGKRGRARPVKSIIGATVFASIVGSMYQILTGDKRNPYQAHQIAGDLSLGGLATGTQDQVGDFTRDLINASLGDKQALGATINNIVRAGDTFIPFYDETINGLEVLTDTYSLDKAVLRIIRTEFDDRYKGKSLSFYKKNRTGIKKAQHALFGTDKFKDKKSKKKLKIKF